MKWTAWSALTLCISDWLPLLLRALSSNFIFLSFWKEKITIPVHAPRKIRIRRLSYITRPKAVSTDINESQHLYKGRGLQILYAFLYSGETPLDCAPAMLQYKMRNRMAELAAGQPSHWFCKLSFRVILLLDKWRPVSLEFADLTSRLEDMRRCLLLENKFVFISFGRTVYKAVQFLSIILRMSNLTGNDNFKG